MTVNPATSGTQFEFLMSSRYLHSSRKSHARSCAPASVTSHTSVTLRVRVQLVEVVCCKMTEIQRDLYCHFLESKAASRLLNTNAKGGCKVLSAITSLKKLCNHPKLIYDAIHSKASGGEKVDGFEGCEKFFPPGAPPLRAPASPNKEP